MIVDTFRSKVLGNERPIWIRRPSVGSCETLTVFLDGEFYRDRVDAPSVIDALQGEIADSWFVFVSMGTIEARWRECPCHPPFAQAIVEELLPWLHLRFAEIWTVQKRVLVGLSYTGLAAAFVARQYPDMFQRVICQSGSFWWNDCWLVEQIRVQPPTSTAYFLEVGTNEVQTHVRHREDVLQVVSQIEGVRRFRDALHGTGHAVRYVEFEGGHEFAAWKRMLPDALRWALAVRSGVPTTPCSP